MSKLSEFVFDMLPGPPLKTGKQVLTNNITDSEGIPWGTGWGFTVYFRDCSLATPRFQIVTCGPERIPDWSAKSYQHPFPSSCSFLHLSCEPMLQFILPSRRRTSTKRPAETKHMAFQTKESSQAPEQLSLATYLHQPRDDYSSAAQDAANFSRKPYMCAPSLSLSHYSSFFYLSHHS